MAIPEALTPWVPWVLDKHRELKCAMKGAERECSWPTSLDLKVTSLGASFSLQGSLDRESEVSLPGSPGVFPLDVRLGEGIAAPVAVRQGVPKVRLSAGRYALVGAFAWSEIPKSLQIPPEVALVSLSLRGEVIDQPLVSDRGELWLKEVDAAERAAEDTASAMMFRRLEDGVPFKILSQLVLRISGKAREVALGAILPASSTLSSISSPLETRVGSDGVVRVQARPGEHRITFESLLSVPPKEARPALGSLPGWPEEEIWVWVPNEEFRTAQLSGPTLIDSSRTELPEEWAGLTTYVVRSQEALSFETVRRGEQEQGANSLHLARTAWLSLDGKDLVVQDTLTGSMNREWRLNAMPELNLSRVSIDGRDQLITEDPKTKERGVEVRSQSVSLVAESTLAAELRDLPVVGWNHAVQSAELTLNLPPGWELLHASGADSVSSTWLASWSLLDVFLVLLAAAATYRLIGKSSGILVLCALLLLHQQAGSPQLIYFHLLAGYALLQFLPESGFRRFVKFHYNATLVLFGVLVVTFSFHHLIQALFPSVLPPGGNLYGFLEPFFYLIESTIGGWVMFTLFVWGAQLFFTGNFLSGFLYGAGALALAAVVGVSATFTEVGSYDRGGYTDRVSSFAKTMPQSALSMAPAEMDSEGLGGSGRSRGKRRQLQEVDAGAVVQTGLGLPTWDWKSARLSWAGRVEPDYRASLYLVGPFAHGILSLVRVALLFAILVLFMQRSSPPWWARLRFSKRALASIALLSFVLSPQNGFSQPLPDAWHLGQLEERLLRDICQSECVTLTELKLTVTGTSVRGEAKVSSQGAGAFALPGPLSQLGIGSVTLDGSTTGALRREPNGVLWVRVPTGVHTLSFSGRLRGSDVVTLQFPVNPQHVSISAPEWEVDGVSSSGGVQESVQFTRRARTQQAGSAVSDPGLEASSWIEVRRELGLSLPWSVTTTVTRSGSLERPELVKVRLLDSESVVTPGIKVESQTAQVLLQRGVAGATWEGTLSEQSPFSLVATAEPRTSEVWNLSCSALWQCAVSGLSPERSVSEGQSGWAWRPFPGESVSVAVTRPQGASGQSLTIDEATYFVTPGVRALDGVVILSLRASQGGFKKIVLPENATLTRVLINSQDETTRYQGTSLSLPVRPGSTSFEISFSAPREEGAALRAPLVKVDGISANVSVKMYAPGERWVVFTAGPGLGPIVLFWGKLLAVVLFALLLGRAPLGPFGARQWTLLGLGLATLPVSLMLVPVLWAWLINYRTSSPSSSRFRFNLMQVLLSALTFLMLMVFYRAISEGLIISPDMSILGYQSSPGLLSWYVDYLDGSLPQPVMYSLPLWAWRILMLVWSTWLVFSLLGWLKWGYQALSTGGLWITKPAKKNATESAASEAVPVDGASV